MKIRVKCGSSEIEYSEEITPANEHGIKLDKYIVKHICAMAAQVKMLEYPDQWEGKDDE